MEWIFTGIGYLIKFIFKCIGYFLKYTLPLWFCVIGCFLGLITSVYVIGDQYSGWELEQRAAHTHSVVIHWDEGSDVTTLQVRDDLNWNICGYTTGYADIGLYYTEHIPHNNGSIPEIVMPQQTKKVGYNFMGLYTSPLGGTQFVNAAGYSVRTVDMDIDLYAIWQKVD